MKNTMVHDMKQLKLNDSVYNYVYDMLFLLQLTSTEAIDGANKRREQGKA